MWGVQGVGISNLSRLPSNLGLKRVPFFAQRGLQGNLNPPKKGIRVLLGILVKRWPQELLSSCRASGIWGFPKQGGTLLGCL